MNKKPVVRVIIPAFNEAERLPETLQRIVAFTKAQSFITEVIVVDNSIADATKDIIMDYHSRYPFITYSFEAIQGHLSFIVS